MSQKPLVSLRYYMNRSREKMSNPKSKIHATRSFRDDMKLSGRSHMGDIYQERPWSSYSRKRAIGSYDQNKVLKELTVNRRGRKESLERKLARVTRRKSLKISYDPNREPGSEFLVERDDNDIDATQAEEEDNVFRRDSVDGLTEFRDENEHLEHDTDVNSNVSIQGYTEFGNESEKENVETESVRVESVLSISDVHNSISLESFQDTELTETPRPSSPLKQLDLSTQLPSSPKISDRTEKNEDTIESAKESSSSSLPPPNFKSSLLKRVHRISTPRKTPRFSPRLERTPENNRRYEKNGDVKATERTSESGTFVKDSVTRFQRQDSTESIRDHYDKHIRRDPYDFGNTFFARHDNTSIDRNAKPRFKRSENKSAIKNSASFIATPEATDARKGVLPVTGKMQMNVKQYENHLSSLAKKPVTHKGQTNREHTVKDSSWTSGATDNFFSRFQDSDDIFSELDNRSKLRQAQYITEDLKLVKRKVKETEITMKQNMMKKDPAATKKISVLKNLNKQKRRIALQRSRLPTRLPQPAKKYDSKSLISKHEANTATESALELDTQTEVTLNTINGGMGSVSSKFTNRNMFRRESITTKSSHPAQSQYSLDTSFPPVTKVWQPQPKIHRPNPVKRNVRKLSKTSKRSDRTFWVTPATSATTNSVERWVVQTIKENSINKDTLAIPKVEKGLKDLVLHRVIKKPKLKVKIQRKQPKPSNTINMGVYLPLTTRPRRRAKHVYTQVGKVKGYEKNGETGQSEIPILYSDNDDGDPDQRPSTVNERRFPYYRRYEGDGDHVRINYRNPAHKKVGRTNGALVRLFRNGDPDHKGLPLTINQKFKNFESLLKVLDDKIPTPTGVKFIFKWPEGFEIRSVKEFQNRCVYIVSSTKNLRYDIKYGESREGFWCNAKPSASKVRHDEIKLFKRPSSPKGSPKASPYMVNIVHNRHREKREIVILNPYTNQSFEKWLEDISYQGIPSRALYVDRPPFTEIKSFSKLFRELQNRSNFIACGDEIVPVELAKKRQAPSSNSSTESMTESRGRKNKLSKQQDMDQIYENDRPDTTLSRYDSGPRYSQPLAAPQPPRILPSDVRRKPRGCVEIEIDGCLREFWPPSYFDSEDDGTRPNQMLKLDWVYGFRGRDARHNLAVLPDSGEMIYYVASIVVIYNKHSNTQRHYTKHNEEITCLTVHPNGELIATGQLHGKAAEHSSHIRIWDHRSLSTYSVIGFGIFYGGIISIGFSHDMDGKLMCVLDGSSKHVLSVWRVSLEKDNRGDESNYIIARTSTTTDAVHCACFYPGDGHNSILITYGAKHIYFWKIFFDSTQRKEAKIMRDRMSGIFEEHRPKSVNCLAFLQNGDVVTGDSSGNLMVWDRDSADAFTCKYVAQAHSAPIMSVVALEDGTILSGAGNEMKAWDPLSNFSCIITRTIPPEHGGVRSIVTHVPGGSDGNIYIGTTRSCILDGSFQDRFICVLEGHSDRILGLTPHPVEPTFFTAGTDAVVYKWSSNAHRVFWRSHIEYPCTSIAVDDVNDTVALGTSSGVFVILNAFNGMHITSVQVGTEPISCLGFSRNGTCLAVGCNDGLITIFDIHDRGHTYRKKSPALRGHNNGVAHLDWSKDGNSLQSVSNDNELLFWDLISNKQNMMPQKTRDIEWHTNTCNVSYALIGPWTNLERGEQIKQVNRSRHDDLVLVGDTSGRLRLYKYPCSRERADFRNVRVYSSEVTACAFTPDSRGALTCGGNDAALIQWTVEQDFQ